MHVLDTIDSGSDGTIAMQALVSKMEIVNSFPYVHADAGQCVRVSALVIAAATGSWVRVRFKNLISLVVMAGSIEH